jgi:signal transduction histidine kinase
MFATEPGDYRSAMASYGDHTREGQARRLLRLDLFAAATLTVVAQLELWLTGSDLNLHGGGQLSAAVTLSAMTGALALRRRAPLAVIVVVVGAFVVQAVVVGPVDTIASFVALLVAMYSVAAESHRRPALVGLVVGFAGVVPSGRDLADWAFIAVVLGSAWSVGRIVRAHRQLAAELAMKNDELEAERTRTARLAVSEERARIAREVHDVLAHTVSVMVVQADAAEELLATDTTRSRAMLVSIQKTGREALGELRRLLGAVRDDAPAPDRAPQPGLHSLDDLVAQVREAGLAVNVTREGEPRQLSPGVDLCAFRIVQEALTNTLKHARATTACVALHFGRRWLDVHVTDNGVGAQRANGGHGLIGIRERVALYGGRVELGNGDHGGFEVHARLPFQGGVA